MSGETARLKLAELPEGQAMNATEINTVLGQLDALVDCCLKGVFVDAAPVSPSDGDVYLVGGSPSGDWGAEYTYKLAYRRDGAWEPPVVPFDGMRAFVPATNAFLVYCDGVWTDWNSLIGTAETGIASAATCDIGAAGSLFLTVTGTTAITSFGTAANRLRFLRFAGALTLTHNAVSLILPGGVSLVTAAGDTAGFTSDGGGNWRCLFYQHASGQPVAAALSANALALGGDTSGNILGITQNQNGHSVVGIRNNSSGATAYSSLQASNGTDTGGLYLFGTGYSASGPDRPRGLELYCNGSGGISHVGAYHTFSINTSEALRVGSDGSLLLGTTVNGGGVSAKQAVQVAGGTGLYAYSSGSSGAVFRARTDNSGPYSYALDYGGTIAAGLFCSAGNVYLRSEAGTSINMQSSSGGVVLVNGATAWASVSDARLKDWSGPQADYRQAIRAVEVGDFTWKAGGAADFGVCAQQLHAALAGTPLQGVFVRAPEHETDNWLVASDYAGKLALWGVKDLYALVEALAARVTALEAAHAAG